MKIPAHDSSPTRFIAVGGGKGGVGKSIVAANLAIAIADHGARVVLVDCDLGAANQHVLFGIDRPLPGLQALLDKKIDSLDEAMTPTPHPNLHLIAGTGAAVGAANINHGEKKRILRRLRGIKADVVLIDVGAGVSYNVLDFFELGGQKLLVVNPQVTSIQTAYSFLKGAVLRTLHHHAEKAEELELLAPATKSGENEKVSQILTRIKERAPELASDIGRVLDRFGAQIVGNQVFDPSQAGIFHAISRMIQDFLGITVPILGTVRASRRIRESVNLRRPMMLGQRDDETRAFEQMAEALMAEDVSLDDLLVEDSGAHDLTPITDPDMGVRPAPAAAPAPPPVATPSVSISMKARDDEGATGVAVQAAPPDAAGPSDVNAPAGGFLEGYARRSPRVQVDWMGTLRGPSGVRPVRIFEVSEGGAVVQSAQPPDDGQELALVFEQVPSQPQALVRVGRKTADGFVVEGSIPDVVMNAASTASANDAAASQPAPPAEAPRSLAS